ncbi:MAG TPA: glutamate-1-semialdehyde 2,1-aminomutase [Candidatus Acidoferrales bacterium]|nr:glutamate-1-semialdehyde 2,1-aminomutase [Candidatus Acidoferrales bacterium]
MGEKSKQWLERARRRIPGGVNSPVRAFLAVNGEPPFIAQGSGARLLDVDGRGYIDYVGSWGPLILGHAHPQVVAAIEQAARHGTSFGAPTPLEVEMAEEITAAFPSIQKLRLVNSGTEATMSAIRLARAATGRKVIVKFEGCYHGHVDSLLSRAGSGLATFNLPDSAGVLEEFVHYTRVLPYNDRMSVERLFQARGRDIGAVIVEPVAGNMGCVLPASGFLQTLREQTEKYGALLIFDEVITGFRIAYGGAQERFGVRADLTTLGKIIGGGLPVGAYGGLAKLMAMIAPDGPVYQAGTLSGNPLAVSAGLAALRLLKQEGTYARLEALGAKLGDGLAQAAAEAGVPVQVNRCGSMLTVFFSKKPVTDYTSAKRSDTAAFARFHRALLEREVYWPPAQFEAAFVSLVHSEEDIEHTLAAARDAFAQSKS